MPLNPSSFLEGHTFIITSKARFKFLGHGLLRILHQKNGPLLPLVSGNIPYIQKQPVPLFSFLGPSFTARYPIYLYGDNEEVSLSFIHTDTMQPSFLQTAVPWTPLGDSTHASWNKGLGPLGKKSQDLRYLWFWQVVAVVLWALVWSWCSLGPIDVSLHGEEYDARTAREEVLKGWSPGQCPLPESEAEIKALRAINFRYYSINLQPLMASAILINQSERLIIHL